MRIRIARLTVFCVFVMLSLGSTVAQTALQYATTQTVSKSPLSAISSPVVSLVCSLSQTTTVVDASCAGNCDGSAQVVASNGDGPYTYLWDSGQSTSAITGLCAGPYCVTVTDSLSCQVTACITVSQPASIVLTESHSDAHCGQANGMATATVTGGTTPYTYQWDDLLNQTTLIAANLTAGIYALVINDSNGCVATMSVTLLDIAAPVLTITAFDSVSCSGVCDGTATTAVSGGVAPYTYLWDDSLSQTTVTAANLCAGLYVPMVTDSAGCIAVATVSISEPASIVLSESHADAHCGQADGMATATVTGGTTPYTYAWSNSSTSMPITNLVAGVYILTVTDANNCSQTLAVTVNDLPGPTVTITSSGNVSCYGGSDGFATASVTGGTPPYTYQWDDPLSQATPTAANLAAGIYVLAVNDSNGCVASISVTITEPDSIVLNPALSDPTCFGYCDGALGVSVSGGIAPYTYIWNDGSSQTTATATGLCAGSYIVVVTDSNGCNAIGTYSLSDPLLMTATSVSTDELCLGSCDGTIAVTVTNGTPAFTYQWNDPGSQGTPTATGLCSGAFNVTITDANACSTTLSDTIGSPVVLVTSVSSSGNVSCFGYCDGYAQSTTSGGTPPYSYQWDDGQTAFQAISLCAGTYCVTVTDVNGCQAFTCVTIMEPQNLVITTTQTNVTCNGVCDGTATANVSGGTTPYTYLWNDISFQTTATASNLCNGIYNVTVVDNNGCTEVNTVIITQPQQLGLASTMSSSTCGFNNGSACVSVIGGVAPYIIQWNDPFTTIGACAVNLFAGVYNPVVSDANGCSFTMPVVVNDITGPTIDSIINTDVTCGGDSNGTASVTASGVSLPLTYVWKSGSDTIGVGMTTVFGLWGGTYTITVIDANGCIAGASASINEPSPVVSAIISSSGASCSGVCDGTASVIAGGGVAPYSYLWTDGCTTTSCDSLCAGTHNVFVTDNNGCTTTNSLTISQQFGPLNIYSNNVTCNGACDGNATATASGGTAPYTYQWDDPGLQTTQMADSLCEGIYNVTITNSTGCSQSAFVLITEPGPLSIATSTVVDATCGFNNGSACVNVMGGMFPYLVQWNDPGATIGVCMVNVYAGVYNPIVMDANGCYYTEPVLVNDLGGPTIDSVTTTDVPCGGDSNGTASVFAFGASGPLTYVWKSGSDTVGVGSATIFGLWGGSYTVYVLDSNSCVSSMSFTINEPLTITPTIISSAGGSCFGVCDGMATVMSTGGVPPYSYAWTDGQTTSTATGQCAGVQNIFVSDANNCTVFTTVTITEPQVLSITDSISEISCNGEADGAIYVNVSGGTPFYLYSWTPSAGSGPIITNLSAQCYTLTIQDINGCVVNEVFCLTEPAPLSATGASTPSSCGMSNGTAIVNPIGGTAPYSYLWDDPMSSTTDNVTGLLPRNPYYVTITDANGCVFIMAIPVGDAAAPAISVSSVGVQCYGDDNGQATAMVDSLGTPPFTYQWDDPLNQNTATATNLPGDATYTVTVTDFNGCTASLPIYISENPELVLIAVGDDSICSGDSIEISVTGSGGFIASDYSYMWSNGVTTQAQWVSPDTTTTYTVSIEDDLGCTSQNNGMVTIDVSGPVSVSLSYEDTICDGSSVVLYAILSGGGGSYSYNWNGLSTSSSLTVSPSTTTTYGFTGSGMCQPDFEDSATVVVETCLSILENGRRSESLSIYPNPTTGELLVELEFNPGDGALIEVFHYTGALVYSSACDSIANKISHSVDLDGQAKGIYFVRVQSGDAMWTGKIVLE